MSTDNATTSEKQEEGGLQIFLHQTSNPSAGRLTLTLPIASSCSANTLRRLASDATTIPLESLRLIYRGKLIAAADEGNVVTEYKLEEDCVVHCLGKATGSGAGAPAASSVASTTGPAAANAGGSRPVGASVIPPPAAAAAAAAAAASSASTGSTSSPLQTALETLRTSSSTPELYTTALTTLSKLLTNISTHPTIEKYRRVKRSNPAFQKRLGGLSGGHEVMLAVGFEVQMVEGVEHYVLVANAEAWTKLVESQRVVESASEEARRNSGGGSGAGGGVNGASPFGTGVPPAGGMGMGAGMPNMGLPNLPDMGLPGMDMSAMMNSPQMQAAAADMLSNPQAIQSMLQDPMVQRMMENDPRFANNPMARSALERMRNDPHALAQMSQMMSDPSTRQMMMNMQAAMNNNGGSGMGGMGGAGGMGAGTGTGTGGAAGTTPPNPAQLAEQMRLMQQMMGAMGGATGGGTGSGMPPQPSSTGANNASSGGTGQQNNSNNSGSGSGNGNGGGNNDDEMTEEEMIQEAIRRSLNEN